MRRTVPDSGGARPRGAIAHVCRFRFVINAARSSLTGIRRSTARLRVGKHRSGVFPRRSTQTSFASNAGRYSLAIYRGPRDTERSIARENAATRRATGSAGARVRRTQSGRVELSPALLVTCVNTYQVAATSSSIASSWNAHWDANSNPSRKFTTATASGTITGPRILSSGRSVNPAGSGSQTSSLTPVGCSRSTSHWSCRASSSKAAR